MESELGLLQKIWLVRLQLQCKCLPLHIRTVGISHEYLPDNWQTALHNFLEPAGKYVP